MVELHYVPPLANFHHEPLVGTLKQRWLFVDLYSVWLLPHVTTSVTDVPC